MTEHGPVILGLPEHLAHVPPAPNGPEDPDRHAKRATWAEWRENVKAYRAERHRLCATDPKQQQLERIKCKRSRAYFQTIWGVLHEPRRRKSEDGQPPFIPFAKQVELLDLLDAALHSEGDEQDLVVSKCRDVGATWVLACAAVHDWLFEDASIVGFISYKEEYADSPDMKSIMAKARHILDHLPLWLKPGPKETHRKHLLLKNRINGNEIFGDSTTANAMVGARGSWALFDELAKHQHGQAAWGSTSSAFDTRVGVSTEDFTYGTFFRDLWKGKDPAAGQPRVLEIDWWDNPMLDDQWFESRRRRDAHDPAKFALEVLRNPYAGPEVFVYPEAREIVPDAEYDYVPGYPLYVAMDPGVRDDCAIVVVQDRHDLGIVSVIDGYSTNGKPADYYGTILSGRLDIDRWGYDDEAFRVGTFFATAEIRRVYGDVSGWNREGTTMDSFYTRLEPYGIIVIRDRQPDGEIAQSQQIARSYRGRREALHALFPRLRFGTTPGAYRVLDALQNNRYKPSKGAVQTEERIPLHDDTSHYTSAMEYYAVNRDIETALALQMVRMTKPTTLRTRRRNQLSYQTARYTRWTA